MNQKVFETIKPYISEKWRTFTLEFVTFCNNKYCVSEGIIDKELIVSEQVYGNIKFFYQGKDIDKAIEKINMLIHKYCQINMN